jgi:hypothetical protein
MSQRHVKGNTLPTVFTYVAHLDGILEHHVSPTLCDEPANSVYIVVTDKSFDLEFRV